MIKGILGGILLLLILPFGWMLLKVYENDNKMV